MKTKFLGLILFLTMYKTVLAPQTNHTYKQFQTVGKSLKTPVIHYKALLGIKYLYGGNDISKGVDCSSLIRHIYKQDFDIILPRTSNMQSKLVNIN